MAMADKDGGPAFPCEGGPEKRLYPSSGMSLRDYFAGQALAGMNARDSYDHGQKTPSDRAAVAYTDADAMLTERTRESD